MDALVISLWARETGDALAGARVMEAGLFGPWRAALRLDSDTWLTLSLERTNPAIFLDERPRRKSTGGLPGEMERMLLGARLTALDATPGERILAVTTDRGTLVVELMPSAPALAALDAERRVLALLANSRSRPRRLAPGNVYTPPDAPEGIAFPGLERTSRAALEALSAPCAPAGWRALVDVAAEHLAPAVVPRGNGFRATVAARATSPHTTGPPATSWNTAVREAFIETLRTEREARVTRAFTDRLKTLERRVTRTLDATEKDLERARDWPTWERYGSALMAHAHLVRRGESHATLPDVFDPGGRELTIPIDPRLGANANAAGYMKRAKRGRRSIDIIEARRDALRSDAEWITERRSRPVDAWTDADRAHLESLLVKHRVRTQRAATSPRDDRGGERFHPKRYRTSDGWLVLVGRNNEENDHLSLKIAKQEDIWLHAHGVSGSHVVMKREGKKDNPSKQALEEAAAIAALHSKARHAGSVPVVYTKAKYVRKPRKAPAGLVTCEREKTIMVRPASADKLVTDDDHTDLASEP